jgi:tetratricopeptide (TPR) repeat protein
MGQILILGNRSAERSGLALFMEFVGHRCTEADSLSDAVKLLGENGYDLVLADAAVGDADSEKIIEGLKTAAPKVSVIILADEGAASVGMDEVITSPLTAIQNVSPQFPPVRKGEAFLVLLPEADSLKMLPDLPQSPGLLNKLALIYQSHQKYTAAEQLYKRAMQISENAPGDSSREAASILMNLASLYQEQRKYAEAEGLYQRSLALAEKVHGPTHPKVARRLRRLAELYRIQGKEKEAAPVHERLRKMA